MKKMSEKVCIIGLGYVGLPLAVQCALKGYKVFGLDTDKTKIRMINNGRDPIGEDFLKENLPKVKIEATSDASVIKKSDYVLICVPTPVDESYFPDLGPVIKATKTVIKNLKKGQLVVVESTINPGVCEEVVEPLFAEAGYKVGRDYYLAHCPERINPGDPVWNVTNIPRVVGSFDKTGLKKAQKFYESIIDAEITPMKSIREAEAVKIMENSFRDINIAFVNELAKSFDRMDIDIIDVIKGASTKPYAFMPHWPSCGVGGHCIPVDPYYLIERAKKSGFDHEFLRIARKINNSMPEYTIELLKVSMNNLGLSLKDARIGLLGMSYKANVADLRESPSLHLVKLLRNNLAKVEIFDPYLADLSTTDSLEEILKKSDVIVLATNHQQFIDISPATFKKNRIKVIVDGKNCLDKDSLKKLGIMYTGIGR